MRAITWKGLQRKLNEPFILLKSPGAKPVLRRGRLRDGITTSYCGNTESTTKWSSGTGLTALTTNNCGVQLMSAVKQQPRSRYPGKTAMLEFGKRRITYFPRQRTREERGWRTRVSGTF